MRLGVNLGYWGAGNDADAMAENLAIAVEADRAGYSVAWAAEAYGFDAPTVLAWVGAHTSLIDIGAAVMQIPARTPAMTAMTAATLDALSGGRFRLGLGVSGPQVSEGWHGVPFASPLGRTREYVDVVQMALAGKRVAYDGAHVQLPVPGGQGKPLRLTVHPVRAQIPLYLAAIGPKNLELAGEIADGVLLVFFGPDHASELLDPLRTGRSRARHEPANGEFDVVSTVPVCIDDDLEAAADHIRAYTALYVGGMGSRQANFYNALVRRMGFEEAAERVQALYLQGRHREAAAALPLDLIDCTALIGSRARVRDRLQRYADAGVSTLSVMPFASAARDRQGVVRTMAELVDQTGLRTLTARVRHTAPS